MKSLAALALLTGMATATRADDIGDRLQFAHRIAREHNDRALVDQVETVASRWRAGEPVDGPLAEVEKAVGIDPGGWSMAGQPVFRPPAGYAEAEAAASRRLAEAMQQGDAGAVRAAVGDWLGQLGDQAGVPDGRRPGWPAADFSLDPAAATRLFVEALGSEARAARQLSEGRGLPGQMLRFDGYVLDAVVEIRPHVARLGEADTLARLDALARGVAERLVSLQQPAGHFPFPDLRGRNLRFGAMIERQLAAGTIVVRDGWVLTADPDGGSQFDTGVCGVALLRAGRLYGQPAWIESGRRAAEWALAQVCVPNFNYNAFSVSLLAEAARVTGEARFLDAAWDKWRVGVGPGQAPGGRWVDPHNARSVYHVIILRAIGDLLAALPPDPADPRRAGLEAAARPAMATLFDEFDAMGVTVECLPELLTLRDAFPDHSRLGEAIRRVAGALVVRSTDGQRVKLAVQPHQLAALARAAR